MNVNAMCPVCGSIVSLNGDWAEIFAELDRDTFLNAVHYRIDNDDEVRRYFSGSAVLDKNSRSLTNNQLKMLKDLARESAMASSDNFERAMLLDASRVLSETLVE